MLTDILESVVSHFKKEEITDEQILQHHYILAKEGVTESMFSYAILCFSDFGGPKNLGHGEYWLNLAANKGHSNAQYFLGMLYFEGDEIEKNEMKGRYWLTVSATNGHLDAQSYFE